MDKVKQSPVFLQVYIIPDKVKSLEALLNSGGNPQKPGGFFNLSKIESVHFSRWIIAPADGEFKASVIYSGNVDGTVNQHLDDLVEHLTDDLDQILSLCVGYPEEGARTRESRLAFLKAKSFSTPAFYVGVPGRSVSQIKNEDALHQALRDFVHKNKGKWKTNKEAYKALKAFVADDPKWDWARKDFKMPKKKIFKLILFGIFMLAILPLVILGILSVFLFHELWDTKKTLTMNDLPIERLQKLKSREDIIYQNQLSQVFVTKRGMRKVMLRFILWVTNFLAQNLEVKGQLMGTPTIHFARWVFIDGGKRFVFFSNFDGSYDGYLGDFVDNNGWGLNAIYGAAKGYPRTWFLFAGGSYKIALFMGWGRNTQVETPLWYSAYPWEGLQQIESKSELRVRMFNMGELDDKEIQELLRRI